MLQANGSTAGKNKPYQRAEHPGQKVQIDEQRFRKHMRMYSLEDGRRQLSAYQRASSNHFMTCLGMRSPNQMLELYHGMMQRSRLSCT